MKKLFSQLFAKKPTAEKTIEPVKINDEEIGYNGTLEDIAAVKPANSFLAQGALKAFNEGRPENLQTILAGFSINSNGWLQIGTDYLYSLYRNNENSFNSITAEKIELMIGKVSVNQGQLLIADMIDSAMRYSDTKSLFALTAASLIKPHAFDKHTLNNLLSHASYLKNTPLVTVLYNKGGDFDEALFEARINNNNETVKRLEIYQKKLTGENTVDTAKTVDILTQIQQQMKELTEKVERLSSTETKPAAVTTVKLSNS